MLVRVSRLSIVLGSGNRWPRWVCADRRPRLHRRVARDGRPHSTRSRSRCYLSRPSPSAGTEARVTGPPEESICISSSESFESSGADYAGAGAGTPVADGMLRLRPNESLYGVPGHVRHRVAEKATNLPALPRGRVRAGAARYRGVSRLRPGAGRGRQRCGRVDSPGRALAFGREGNIAIAAESDPSPTDDAPGGLRAERRCPRQDRGSTKIRLPVREPRWVPSLSPLVPQPSPAPFGRCLFEAPEGR
jgi:hypothetical protein